MIRWTFAFFFLFFFSLLTVIASYQPTHATVRPHAPFPKCLQHTPIASVAHARLSLICTLSSTSQSDMAYAATKLGPERLKGAYAWQTILRKGGRIALGSDFPIESIDPLKGFYAAVTRLDEHGNSPHGPGGW